MPSKQSQTKQQQQQQRIGNLNDGRSTFCLLIGSAESIANKHLAHSVAWYVWENEWPRTILWPWLLWAGRQTDRVLRWEIYVTRASSIVFSLRFVSALGTKTSIKICHCPSPYAGRVNLGPQKFWRTEGLVRRRTQKKKVVYFFCYSLSFSSTENPTDSFSEKRDAAKFFSSLLLLSFPLVMHAHLDSMYFWQQYAATGEQRNQQLVHATRLPQRDRTSKARERKGGA